MNDVKNQSPKPPSAPLPKSGKPDPVAVSREIGGRNGPDPTRYGDWERNGKCVDF
jgi:hypothetical protein